MNRSDILEIRQQLQQSRAKTAIHLQGVDEAQAMYRIRFDAWSIKDHVIHLAEVEDSVIHFAHRILHEDCPISPLCHDKAFSQEAWNQRVVAASATTHWSEIYQKLLDIRQELLALLGRISDSELSRIGSHPVWGTPVTLASVLRVPYRHERPHRDEIAVLRTLPQKLS